MSRKPIFGEKAKMFSCRLYSWEKLPVKKFIKQLRKEKYEEIFIKMKGIQNGN